MEARDIVRVPGGVWVLDRLVQHSVQALDEGDGVFKRHAFEQQCLV